MSYCTVWAKVVFRGFLKCVDVYEHFGMPVPCASANFISTKFRVYVGQFQLVIFASST